MDSFDRQWQRWFPESREEKPTRPNRRDRTSSWVLLILVGALALFILINIAKGLYTEWLWFNSLGYDSVFTTILKTKVLVFFIAAISFATLFLGNLVLATRLSPKTEAHFWPWAIVRRLEKILQWNVILGTALLSLIFGLVAQATGRLCFGSSTGSPLASPTPFLTGKLASTSSHCLSFTYCKAGSWVR